MTPQVSSATSRAKGDPFSDVIIPANLTLSKISQLHISILVSVLEMHGGETTNNEGTTTSPCHTVRYGLTSTFQGYSSITYTLPSRAILMNGSLKPSEESSGSLVPSISFTRYLYDHRRVQIACCNSSWEDEGSYNRTVSIRHIFVAFTYLI